MTAVKIAFIVGSLRKESLNLKLAKALIKLGGSKIEGQILRIDDLPLFNQDLEADFPAPAKRLKSELESAEAVLIVTPEYNRAMPGPLKNAIDWASRPYGTNSFAHKPLAIVGTSPGAVGTACAQATLRSVFSYLDVKMMGQPEIYLQYKDDLIDKDGNITNEKSKEFLLKYIETFIAFAIEEV